VQTLTAEFIDAARPARHATGHRWFVDETYVKIAGRWTYLYRAVDQYGTVEPTRPLASQRRDLCRARDIPIDRLSAAQPMARHSHRQDHRPRPGIWLALTFANRFHQP
jgi:DDE domain